MYCFLSSVVVPIVLVANKTDLTDGISHLAYNPEFLMMKEGYTMANKIGAYAYLKCSAKLNDGVWAVFETAAKAIFQT